MGNQQFEAQSGTTYPGAPDRDAGDPPVSGNPQGWGNADTSVGDDAEARGPEGGGESAGNSSQHDRQREQAHGGF